MAETIMKYHELTDFERVLFLKEEVKALKKIIEVKNKSIVVLIEQLRLPHTDRYIELESDLNCKDNARVKTIKALENRLSEFKKKYNSLLAALKQ